MSEAMLDKNSWDRALGPAIRAIGYFAAGITIGTLLYYILYLLASLAGLQGFIVVLFTVIIPFSVIFLLFLVTFKVLDEEGILKRPAVINPK